MFAARLVTAIGLLALFCGALILLPNGLWAAFLLLGLCIASFEWAALAHYGAAGRWFFTVIVTVSAVLLLVDIQGTALHVILYWTAVVFWLVVASGWLVGSWRPLRNRFALGVVGWLVLVPTWLALTMLQRSPAELIGMLAIVWVADTAAYLVGRRYGRHHLAPRISPGKTWEGVIGACAAVAVYYSLLWSIFGGDRPLRDAVDGVLLFAAVTAMSVQGDLFESWMKRQAGVKDSGKLLPGHGGILDRIDGLTASMPLAALWFHYFNRPGFL